MKRFGIDMCAFYFYMCISFLPEIFTRTENRFDLTDMLLARDALNLYILLFFCSIRSLYEPYARIPGVR